MANWDVSTPAGSDLLSQGDDKIRELKVAILDSLRCDDVEGNESIFPGSNPSMAPVFRYRGLKGSAIERPSAGQHGLYFNTTRNTFQRDNGSSWDDIGTLIPAGTAMSFYQSSAPVGWTALPLNDKFLRVVTAGGSGGSTGGSLGASTNLAHTHTTPGHTLTVSEIPGHNHKVLGGQNAVSGWSARQWTDVAAVAVSGAAAGTGGSSAYFDYLGGDVSNKAIQNSGGGGSHEHGDTGSTAIGTFAYVDVIIASKD